MQIQAEDFLKKCKCGFFGGERGEMQIQIKPVECCHRSFSVEKVRDPASRRRTPALRSSTYSLLTPPTRARTISFAEKYLISEAPRLFNFS